MNKYLHYRAIDRDGKVASKRGATVAYRTYPDGSMRFAIARVHYRDNFSRAEGRRVADERLKEQVYVGYMLRAMAIGELVSVYEMRDHFYTYMDEYMLENYGYVRSTKKRKLRFEDLRPEIIVKRRATIEDTYGDGVGPGEASFRAIDGYER